ncbi:diaminobutyrate acetyltransferase [Alkalimarinus sediminis]|uniref:L-2,4-diaminobutyric acid acetyltransferase n=1 Tax=Alkalimarinus sediminis TaxID=1632866 RepID=A0A9E8HM72_9ALTE|nr:diaminobutyrate acetyltransferase [Alkalimarinus sediminis]UZW75436.1 diaminobutyrate acetyltransferase [Alkalimarinus sediminis]
MLEQNILLSSPHSTDGYAVSQLINRCPPLDTNSRYCNLLQCSHFDNTSVIAKANDQTVGFISGYILPQAVNTLFIWQVAVDSAARGTGLAQRMIQHIIERPACNDVSHIETTITNDNKASWALFERIAKNYGAPLTSSVMFDRAEHFAGAHETEMLVRIGPLNKGNA